MPAADCPSRAEVVALRVGSLPPDAAEGVIAHLSTCDNCQRAFESVADAEDPLAAHLRRPIQSIELEYLDEPECKLAVARAAASMNRSVSGIADSTSVVADETVLLGDLGEYRLLAKLGEGGMGAVYQALHVHLGRVVALKVLPKSRAEDKAAIARFFREMKAIGQLNHPSIVQAFDAREIEGSPVLVMEYVDGVSLADLTASLGPLPIPEACELARQVAVGLQYAYERGLVHRDIKPSNLMLTPSGQVKILDFGLALLSGPGAAAAHHLTASGQIMGTLDYMAAEQADDSHQVDIRADIYSLGATMHALLAGKPPFAGRKYESLVRKMFAITTEAVPSIAERRADVPVELAAVVDRMTAKSPAERFGTPGEVAAALAPFAVGADLPNLLARTTRHPAPDESGGSGRPSVSSFGEVGRPVPNSGPCADAAIVKDTVLMGAERDTAAVSQASVAPMTRPTPQPRRHSRRRVLAIAGGLAGAALAVAVYVQTNYGRLVIEGDVADAKIVVEGADRVTIIDPQTQRTVRLRPGQYDVRLEEEPAGLTLDTRSFTLKRGDQTTITVRYEPIVAGEKTSGEAPSMSGIWPLGPAQDFLPGLVPRPAKLSGIKRWQVETRLPRGDARAVDWSPDGRFIACGTDAGAVRIYEAETLRLVRVLLGHRHLVYGIAWSPTGDLLASCAQDGMIRLWKPDGTADREIPSGGRPMTVCWSPDGERIAASLCLEGFVVLDRAGKKLASQPHSALVLAWSPDGRWIATGDPTGQVQLWEPNGSPGPVLHRHGGGVTSLCWKPDSQWLASAGGEDQTVRLSRVDGSAGPVLAVAWTPALAWSPDGKWLVSGGDDIRLWDSEAKLVRQIPGHALGIDWRPDGSAFAIGSNEYGPKVCDIGGATLRQAERQMTGTNNPAFVQLSWHPNGDRFTSSGARPITWTPDGKPLTRLRRPGHAVWSPDGRELAVGYGSIAVLNPEGEVGSEISLAAGQDVQFLCWHSNSRLLTCVHQDRKVRMWNRDGTLGPVLDADATHSGYTTFMAWSPSSDVLALVQTTGDVTLWGSDGGLISKLKATSDYSSAIAWSPDGKSIAVAGSKNQLFRLDDGSARELLSSWDVDRAVAFSPDGRRIALGGQTYVLRLAGVQDSSVGELRGHKNTIYCVAWSPDGKQLLSADNSGAILAWNTQTGEPEWVVMRLNGGPSTTFTAAGQLKYGDPQIVEDEFVYIVETDEGKQELLSPAEFYRRFPAARLP